MLCVVILSDRTVASQEESPLQEGVGEGELPDLYDLLLLVPGFHCPSFLLSYASVMLSLVYLLKEGADLSHHRHPAFHPSLVQ